MTIPCELEYFPNNGTIDGRVVFRVNGIKLFEKFFQQLDPEEKTLVNDILSTHCEWTRKEAERFQAK